MSKKRVAVIGAGFSGIAVATVLADKGFDVTVFEKNATPGGRARKMEAEGFTFDMGPSWYWMPDVFEKYFALFNKKPSDYYQLERLDPSYTVIFTDQDCMEVPADYDSFGTLVEQYEKGAKANLDRFMQQAAYKYEVGMNNLVYRPSRKVTEFLSLSLLLDVLRLDVFQSMHKHIRKFFRNEKLVQLMEFPILFLGAMPNNTPALYSLMNYADIKLGTWYPKGGMHKIVEGMVKLAEEKGVIFYYNQEIRNIRVTNGSAESLETEDGTYSTDIVIGSADYNFIEQNLLTSELRTYSDQYWQKRVMAPSSLLFYLGINKRIPKLEHHNLFFDEDFKQHATEIYETPQWPSKPLFYASLTSKTDATVAPEGCENLFLLIPVAPGLEDSEEIRSRYYDILMNRLEKYVGEPIREHVIFKKSYAHKDFIKDYHAFKGNAYGLANTLMQTAILKPSLKSKKVKNLYYTGQLTVPGPGVPPSLISGQVVAKEVMKDFA